MPQLDQKGPEGKGSKTGRKLGKCKKDSDQSDFSLGQGMGKRRKENGGSGQGKRLKSSKIFDNDK
ncbi:MAG: DUF5320 family protein [Bacteroidales bacterium]